MQPLLPVLFGMMYGKFTFASFQSQFPQPATCLATNDTNDNQVLERRLLRNKN